MDSLPQELFIEILGHLPPDDKNSIKNCSLVAKSWRHISQQILLESIMIFAQNLERWMATAPWVGCDFFRNVRHLRCSFVDYFEGQRLPIGITGVLPLERLNHLELCRSGFVLSPQGSERFSPFKKTLSRITLRSCSISKNSFVSLVDYFPNLQFLHLERLSDAGSHEPITRISRTLEKLSMPIESLSTRFLDLLVDLSELGLRFNEVDLQSVEPRDDRGRGISADRVIVAFGASVKRLRLPFAHDSRCNPPCSCRRNSWSRRSHRV
jgi:hypothetical protein